VWSGRYRGRMHGRGTTTIIGAVTVAAVGLVLLAVESIQAIRGLVLGSAGTTLLFVGLGLVVIAATVLTVSTSAEAVTVDAAPAPAEPATPVDPPEPSPEPALEDPGADAAVS
jgi:hypothetical protein